MTTLSGAIVATTLSVEKLLLEITSSAFPGLTDLVDFNFSNWQTGLSSAEASFIGIIRVILSKDQENVYDVKGTITIIPDSVSVVTEIVFEAINQASGNSETIKLSGLAKSSGDKRADIQVTIDNLPEPSFEIVQNDQLKWSVSETSSREQSKSNYNYSQSNPNESLVSAEFPSETPEQDILDSFASFAITAIGGSLPSFNEGAFQQQAAQFGVGFACATGLKTRRK